MRVLCLNPGSSSLKAAVRDHADGEPLFETNVERVDDPADALARVAARLTDVAGTAPDAVAHRVVHGGRDHRDPTLIDDALLRDLRALVPLAPLHLPGSIATIERARTQWPQVPHVACFDTGFHRDLPDAARRLPVPPELAAMGVQRYGFHGLSVQSVLLARPDLGDAVVAHLGSGCSVTAVDADGRSAYTTMSFTPTAGVISSTRTGDIDPEIALYLIDRHGYTTQRVRETFDRGSGLAGVAGGRRDVRDLLAADDADARLALRMFTASAAMAIASCATWLDGWRSLVFTGGVGQHSQPVRDAICARLRLSGVDVLVVPADEERVMDRQVRGLLS